VAFDETDLGVIVKQYIYVYSNGYGAVGMQPDNWTISGGIPGWRRFTHIGGSWPDQFTIGGGVSGAQIMEAYKEVEYTPYSEAIPAHAADGVALTGNSVANTVIGDLVACDVNGIYDDDAGTITGIPNTNPLIERPDHVRKHILINLLGFLAADINASFDTVGAVYNDLVYKFAFNLPDVAIKVGDLFGQMDLQSRTRMFEWGGQFYLVLRSTEVPTSVMDFDKNNIQGNFLFGKSDVVDIKNSLIGYYFRDYSKSGSPGEKYRAIAKVSSSPSITKYGLQQEEIEFSCADDSGIIVEDVLAWLLGDRKELKKTVEFNALWDAFKLEPFDAFTVISQIAGWSGKKFSAVGISYQPESELIKMKGEQVKEIKTQTRLPVGDLISEWTPHGNPNNWQNVAETVPDDFSTYNESADADYSEDQFLIDPFSIPADAIDISVRVTIRCKKEIDNSDPILDTLVFNSGSYSMDAWSEPMYPTQFNTYERIFVNNPKTGLPWTVAEINGIGNNGIRGVGYSQWRYGSTNLKAVTMCYISVDYKA
jgi:hypothetical protein